MQIHFSCFVLVNVSSRYYQVEKELIRRRVYYQTFQMRIVCTNTIYCLYIEVYLTPSAQDLAKQKSSHISDNY